jgi:hypothetical protein
MFENPGNYFGRFSNLFKLNSNLNLNFGHVTLALAISLFLYNLFCKPTKGRERICWRSLSGVQGFYKSLPLVVFA